MSDSTKSKVAATFFLLAGLGMLWVALRFDSIFMGAMAGLAMSAAFGFTLSIGRDREE